MKVVKIVNFVGGGGMQLEVSLKPMSGNEINLPLHYNHLVQSVIYNSLGDELASFLHDSGFQSGKRSFKMFSFSRILGRFKISDDKERIVFTDSISIIITSPMEKFCNALLNSFLLQGEIRLGNNRLKVLEVKGSRQVVENNEVELDTLSPIVSYSTLNRLDGRKYTCYFQPGDPDFREIIENNLRKKYQAFYDLEAPLGKIEISVKSRPHLHVVKYKGFIIKGYSGKIRLKGPKELLQIAVDGGLGSKNAQGFGCMKIKN